MAPKRSPGYSIEALSALVVFLLLPVVARGIGEGR